LQEIDIKKQGAVSSYAFCQYSDIGSVVKAMRSMDGEHLGANRIKLGFGKSMPTSCVWVDGIGGILLYFLYFLLYLLHFLLYLLCTSKKY